MCAPSWRRPRFPLKNMISYEVAIIMLDWRTASIDKDGSGLFQSAVGSFCVDRSRLIMKRHREHCKAIEIPIKFSVRCS
jgi:hypothetical protein